MLEQLCRIPGTSGDESLVSDFLLEYVQSMSGRWQQKPEIWAGDGFQDTVTLIFGKPSVAIYAHLDTVGYMVRYDNYLVPIGGTAGETGDILVGMHQGKLLETVLVSEDHSDLIDSREILEPGTRLTYMPRFKQEGDYLKSPYLDDRLGVWALLQLAPTIKNAALVFTTYEEISGGMAGFLARQLFEKFQVSKAIIADVTWVSEGVKPGSGPVFSIRDSRIPRKAFVDQLRKRAMEAKIPFQLEVESQGGSDGREIQHLPYPIDWVFIGPPSENPHSALETVHIHDVEAFVDLLSLLAGES